MKIIKYKKIKNKYRVYFDDESTIDLYENVILNNDLLLKKELTESELKRIKKENDKESIYDISLRYISIKMRSKKEIKDYLVKKEFDKEEINRVIDRLEKNQFINEELYVKSYINDRINLSNDGPYKIKQSLYNKADEKLIDKYINEIDKELIRTKLNKLIDKKINTIKNCNGNVLKYKILSYFSNLGYDNSMIEDILSSKNLNTNNGEKEYYKLYNKYSKKYSGYELESIIKNKLYQKGFDINEIKKNID